MRATPLISVVIPSLNQGAFLAETLQSVVSQSHPHVEVIVIDGGSIDSSIDIIKSFSHRLSFWVSEPDSGQAHAINKGLLRATGDIVCYLNSDDIFMPDALSDVAAAMQSGGDWWTGGCLHFGRNQPDEAQMPSGSLGLAQIAKYSPLPQPATFWSRRAFETVGAFNQNMDYAFDFEYWLRMSLSKFKPVVIPRVLAGFRYHELAKTCNKARFYDEECIMFSRLMNGCSWWQKALLLRAKRWRMLMVSVANRSPRKSLIVHYPEALLARGAFRYLFGLDRK